MRRLIINADDFGLTPGVNRAILEGHTHGLITSATLMANGAAFDEAAALARAHRSLRVGCHTVLVDGSPVAPPERVRSLLDHHNDDHDNDAEFHRGLATFARIAIRGGFSPQDVEAEAGAQFQKLRAAGIAPTHFDTHKHAHMFPSILRPLLRAAQAAGIPAVRNPFVPAKPLTYAHLFRRPRLWTRYAEVKLLRHYATQFRRAVADVGLATTDGTFGIVVTGALDERLFDAIIGSIPEGTWEFVCHPGYVDAALAGVRTRLRASREAELRVLTSARARDIIAARNIELISYADV